MKKIWKLTGEAAKKAVCREVLAAPDGYVATIGEPSRNLNQNAAQWPILEAFAQQLNWPVNGKAQKISADDWKDILTCAFRNEQPRIASTPGRGHSAESARRTRSSRTRPRPGSTWRAGR